MNNKRIAVIGCGNLGSAIVQGLIDHADVSNENITATKRHIESIQHFATEGVRITSDNAKAIQESDIILVALKPYNILETLQEVQQEIEPGRHTIISLATGVSLDELHGAIGHHVEIFRAMPNTAADVSESVTCICTDSTDSQRSQEVEELFNSIGSSIFIEEELMESATILGACGIAYVLRFMRAMVQGGIEIGFDADTATRIVNQTVKGASELLIQRDSHPEEEIDKVTTPKGCTITGLNQMEHHGFSSALIQGIVASFNKIDD
ncbi:MAG: pyrroline-5-carboxylate reductase [Flavobacteriales bacterium]|nr:pyrroline-5-carboxylate reductase [Flavobacteriales bacterium]